MRSWSVDEWSAFAQIVGAVGALLAAVAALWTARQSRLAADSSATAAARATKALALHGKPDVSAWFSHSEDGRDQLVQLYAPGVVVKSAVLNWRRGAAQGRVRLAHQEQVVVTDVPPAQDGGGLAVDEVTLHLTDGSGTKWVGSHPAGAPSSGPWFLHLEYADE